MTETEDAQRATLRTQHIPQETTYRRIGIVLPDECIDWLDRTANKDGSSRSDLLEGIILLAMDDDGADRFPPRDRRPHPIVNAQRDVLMAHTTYLRHCARRSLAVALEALLAGDGITQAEHGRLTVNADYCARNNWPSRADALRAILGQR